MPKPELGLPLKNLKLARFPAGQLMQGFGENCAFYTPNFFHPEQTDPEKKGFKCHNGIDLQTFENDEVLAVCDGTVIDAGLAGARGIGVWYISTPYDGDDGKRRADMYCAFHLNKLSIPEVQAGNLSVPSPDPLPIKKGQVLGMEGNTGDVIAGNNPYWSNAPAHKGVHLHHGKYPLVAGKDSLGRAYQVNGEEFCKEFPDNDENGATDPLLELLEVVKSAAAANVVKTASTIVGEITSAPVADETKMSMLAQIGTILKQLLSWLKGR